MCMHIHTNAATQHMHRCSHNCNAHVYVHAFEACNFEVFTVNWLSVKYIFIPEIILVNFALAGIDTMSKSKMTSTAGEPWSDTEVHVLLSILWGDQSVQH